MSTEQLLPGTDETIGSLRQSLSTIRLPVEEMQRDRLMACMKADLLSLHELAHELLQVPVAALEICRAAGHSARSRDVDVLTLEQACGLLGTQRVATLIAELPVATPAEMPVAFVQMLSISEHALCQARGLFAQRMSRLWNEMALGSLLFLAPFWTLVYQRPELFESWERLHLRPESIGPQERRAARGAPFLVLAQQLAEDWWLPPWIVQGYRSLGSSRRTMVKALHIARNDLHPRDQQAALDNDKYLYRWLTQPANGLLLANGTALGAHHDWKAHQTERWQQLTSLYLGCRLDAAQAASHQCAVEHARSHSGSTGRVWLAAEALLWPGMSRVAARKVNQAAPLRAPEKAAIPRVDPEAWREHCRRLSLVDTPFTGISAILIEALNALTLGLGVRQCWIALYNARERQMVIGASSGTPTRLAGTRLGNVRDSAWGSWLVARRSQVFDPQGTNADPRPPDDIVAVAGNGPGHLLPLSLNGQFSGLLYAHFGDAAPLPRAKQAAALEKTAGCLEKALHTFKTGS
jgi:hypothetical protein